jgi:hypothetical protein
VVKKTHSVAALKYRTPSVFFFTKAKAVWKKSLSGTLFLFSSALKIFPLSAALKYRTLLVLFFSKAEDVWKNSLRGTTFQ